MANSIPSRCDWKFDLGVTSADLDVGSLTDMYIRETLIKTQKMFKWTGLPDTIPQKDLELILQINGNATITEVDGKLYAFRGGLGGVPNAYYLPTISIVANPYLKFNKTLKIDEECVVILNDAMYQGLMPIIKENSYLLAQCDVSFKFSAINSRIPIIFTTGNDETYESVKLFFKSVEKGDTLTAIMDEDMYKSANGFSVGNNSNNIVSLIEMKQYIQGQFYNKLGIQSQFNMKREAINTAEATLDEDILYILVDDMLEQRKKAVEKINKMYGTNISVEFDGVWKQLREQAKLDIKQQEVEIGLEENEDGNVEN